MTISAPIQSITKIDTFGRSFDDNGPRQGPVGLTPICHCSSPQYIHEHSTQSMAHQPADFFASRRYILIFAVAGGDGSELSVVDQGRESNGRGDSAPGLFLEL